MGPGELRDQVGLQQVILEVREYAGLQYISLDRQAVFARTFVAGTGATVSGFATH
jgi:hypothetical protein